MTDTEDRVMALHRAGSHYLTRLMIESERLEEMGRAVLRVPHCGEVSAIKPRLLEAVQECNQARAEFFTLLNSISTTPTADPRSTGE